MEKGQQIAKHQERPPEDQSGRRHHHGHRSADHDGVVQHHHDQHADADRQFAIVQSAAIERNADNVSRLRPSQHQTRLRID